MGQEQRFRPHQPKSAVLPIASGSASHRTDALCKEPTERRKNLAAFAITGNGSKDLGGSSDPSIRCIPMFWRWPVWPQGLKSIIRKYSDQALENHCVPEIRPAFDDADATNVIWVDGADPQGKSFWLGLHRPWTRWQDIGCGTGAFSQLTISASRTELRRPLLAFWEERR
jgi:hypothetical protein